MVHNKSKTYFPSHWSKQEVAEAIFTANQSRIQLLQSYGSREIFECNVPNGLLIDIVIENKKSIVTAYPSLKNFLGIKK